MQTTNFHDNYIDFTYGASHCSKNFSLVASTSYTPHQNLYHIVIFFLGALTVISSNKLDNLFYVVIGSQKKIENLKAHYESFGYVMKYETHWTLFFFKKIKAQVLVA